MPRWDSGDPRVGHLLGTGVSAENKPKVVILGFPTDEGVEINGGRTGARNAPQVIRGAFYHLTPDPGNVQFTELLSSTSDLGDLRLLHKLGRDQKLLGIVVASHLAQGIFPIVLGGGHETAFGHFLGYVEADKDVSILNWDAHADVRELKGGKGHSGSPFRQVIDHPSARCQEYIVGGLLPYSVAESHLHFIREHGGAYYWGNSLTRETIDQIYAKLKPPAFVTFDLDAVSQEFAPGVSAPAVGGMSPELLLHAAWRAGKTRAVTSMDFVEVNPSFDRDNQTARLTAVAMWNFFKGYSERD